MMIQIAPSVAPLCPAGHLPHEGGDQPAARLSAIGVFDEEARRSKLLISPRVGEMSGRTEGGNVERQRSCESQPGARVQP
jgi:hypothetical protein